MDFITRNISVDDVKKLQFFIGFKDAITEISQGELLFESNDHVVKAFSECVKESWLPLPSSTQHVEKKVKDKVFCGSTGKEDQKMSKLAMMRSVMLQDTTASVKESGQFKNRKRRNDEAREHICGKHYDTEVLTRTYHRLDELQTISEEEITHCRNVLRSDNHHKT